MNHPDLRLLLLDDESSLRDPLAKRLREVYGYEVESVASSAEAHAALEANLGRYDVALLDANLGEGPGGIGVLRYIKSTYPHIEVILFTGWGMDNALEALKAGAFRYLAKPFNLEELAVLIQLAAEYRHLKGAEREKQILEQLMKTSTVLLSSLNRDEILNQILMGIQSIGFDRVRLYLIRNDGQSIQGKAHVGMDDNFLKVNWLLKEDPHMLSLLDDPRPRIFRREVGDSVPFESLLSKEDVQEWACIPLILEGKVIGKLSVDRKLNPRPITEEEVHSISLFASQAAVAIETSRLFREMVQRASELEILRKTTLAITSPIDHDMTLQTVLKQAAQLLNAKSGGIDQYDPRSKKLTVIAEYGRYQSSIGNTLRLKEGIAGHLIASDEPYLIVENYAQWKKKVKSYQSRQYQAVIAVPLIWQHRRIGVLYLDDVLGRKFTKKDVTLLSMFADQAAIVLIHSNMMHDLSITKDHLNRLVAGSFDGIMTADIRGNITGANPMVEQILGRPAKEVIGKHVRDFYFDPEEARRVGQLLRQSPDGKIKDYPTSVRSKSGAQVPIRLSAAWIFDAGGNKIGSAGYFKDMRELQETEMQRQRLLEATNAVIQAQTLDDGLQMLANIMVESCIATFCSIMLVDGADEQWIVKAAYPIPRAGKLDWQPGIGTVSSAFHAAESTALLNKSEPVILRKSSKRNSRILARLAQEFGFQASLSSVLVVPLRVNHHFLGACILGEMRNWRRSPITERKIELVRSIASQAAILIEKMNLLSMARKKADVLEAMQKLALTISSTLNPEDTFEKSCQAAVELFGVDHSGLVLFDSDCASGVVVAEYPTENHTLGTPIPVKGIPFEERLIQNKEPIWVLDVNGEEDLGSVGKMMYGCFGIHSTAFVPVIHNEKILGSFSLDSIGHARQFTPEEIEVCKVFAAHVASAVENSRLHEAMRRHNHLLLALDEASRHIRAEKEPEKLLHQIVQLAAELMGCSVSGLFLNHRVFMELELVAVMGLPESTLKTRFSYDKGLMTSVAMTGEPMRINHYLQREESEPLFRSNSLCTLVGIPLKHSGDVEAVLFVADKDETREFMQEDLDVLKRFASQATMALHASQLMGEERRRFSQLDIMHRISDYIMVSRNLNHILHVFLTGITAGYGLAYNRAVFLSYSSADQTLHGQLGIGHLYEWEARQDWHNHHQKGLEDFGKYIAALEGGSLLPTPLDASIRDLKLVLEPSASDPLARAVFEKCWLRVDLGELKNLPEKFVESYQPTAPLIVIPLLAREQVIGLLVADNKFTLVPITAGDVNSLLTFTNSVAVVIDNLNLLGESEAARDRIKSSFKASNGLVSFYDPQQVLEVIAEQAHVATHAMWVSIILIDEIGKVEDFVTTGSHVAPADLKDLIRKDGISLRVMQTGEPFIIRDVSDQKHQVNPRMLKKNVAAALCLPLTLLGQQIGVIWIHYNEPQDFLEYELEAIQLYVNQATIAYENARRMNELEHMRQATEALSGASSLPNVLEQIMQSAGNVLRGDSIVIWSYDDGQRKFRLEHSIQTNIPEEIWKKLQKAEPRLDGTLSKILEQQWLGVTDIGDDKKYSFMSNTTRNLLKQVGVQSFQGIALQVGDEKLGVLYVNYNQHRSFSAEEQKTAMTFANHAAIALKKARLVEQLSRAKRAVQIVARDMTLEIKEFTLASVVQGISSVLDCQAVVLYDYNETTHELNHPPTMVGVHAPNMARRFQEVKTDSIVYRMLARNEPYILENIEDDPIFSNSRFAREEQIKSCVAVPLIAGEKKMGVMFVNYRIRHRFTQDELADLRLFGYQAAVAIHNAQLYEQEMKRANALQSLQVAGQIVTRSLEFTKILNHIAEQASILTQEPDRVSSRSEIVLIGENILPSQSAAYPNEPRPSNASVELEHQRTALIDQVIHEIKPLLIGNLQPENDDQTALHSILAVPICLEDKAIGWILVEHPDRNAFDVIDQIALEALAAQAAIAIQNSWRFEDLKRIKGYIGSKTAVEWIRMVSTAWGHGIRREVGTALGHVKLISGMLKQSHEVRETLLELDQLEGVIRNIGEIPITAPLSSDDAIDSIRINDVLDAHLKHRWKHDRYKPITLELRLQVDLDQHGTVRASREWLRYALDLLVDNAVNAMIKANSEQKHLAIETRRNDGSVEIYLTDTGPGIPPEIRQIIFEEPIQKPVGSKGAGLGLVLARTILQTYDGDVYVESTNNRGTRIRVRLPLEGKKQELSASLMKG